MGLWATVEAAIETWVSGAAPGGWTVIFAEQNASVPEGPFISIRMGDIKALGACDEEIYTTNVGMAPNDLDVTETGMREFSVSLQAFQGKGHTYGDTSPRAVLSAVRQALETPNVRSTMEATGLSPFDNRQPIRNVGAAADTIFEPRAVWECRFYIIEQVVATSTYIETVDAGFTNPGPQEPIPGDFS